jgi:hypothetical protein
MVTSVINLCAGNVAETWQAEAKLGARADGDLRGDEAERSERSGRVAGRGPGRGRGQGEASGVAGRRVGAEDERRERLRLRASESGQGPATSPPVA